MSENKNPWKEVPMDDLSELFAHEAKEKAAFDANPPDIIKRVRVIVTTESAKTGALEERIVADRIIEMADEVHITQKTKILPKKRQDQFANQGHYYLGAEITIDITCDPKFVDYAKSAVPSGGPVPAMVGPSRSTKDGG